MRNPTSPALHHNAADISDRIAAANRIRARADDLELNGGDFVREIANGLREGAGRVERGEVL